MRLTDCSPIWVVVTPPSYHWSIILEASILIFLPQYSLLIEASILIFYFQTFKHWGIIAMYVLLTSHSKILNLNVFIQIKVNLIQIFRMVSNEYLTKVARFH